MDRTINADISAPVGLVATIVGDLATYSAWLELVTEANPAPHHDGDQGPAWLITLRAKIGPFARSKRLRMVRTETNADRHVFERRETDDRDHSPWVMTADVAPRGAENCSVVIGLSYGGSLWSGALDSVLGSILYDAGEQLSAYANQSGDTAANESGDTAANEEA